VVELRVCEGDEVVWDGKLSGVGFLCAQGQVWGCGTNEKTSTSKGGGFTVYTYNAQSVS